MAISSVAKLGIGTFDKFQKASAGNTPATGTLVMGGNNTSNTAYATSTDGATWTLRSATGMGQSTGLYKIGSAFVNTSVNANPKIATILDPISGTTQGGGTRIAPANSIDGTITGLVYTNNGWGVMGNYGWHWNGFGKDTGGPIIMSSMVYGNGIWVLVIAGVVSSASATAEKYPAGLTFTNRTLPITSPTRVSFANNLFVAIGSDGIATSTDGTTWTQRSSAGDFRNSRVMYAGGVWFAAISAGSFYTSTNGTTWTARTSMAGYFLVGATYGNGVYCVMTSQGSLYSSADAVTWTSRTNPVTGTNWINDSSVQGESVLAFG